MFPLKITVTGALFLSGETTAQLGFCQQLCRFSNPTPPCCPLQGWGSARCWLGSESGLPAPAPMAGSSLHSSRLPSPPPPSPPQLCFYPSSPTPRDRNQEEFGPSAPSPVPGPCRSLSAVASEVAGPAKARAGKGASLCLSLACGVPPAGAELSMESRLRGGLGAATDPFISSSNKK